MVKISGAGGNVRFICLFLINNNNNVMKKKGIVVHLVPGDLFYIPFGFENFILCFLLKKTEIGI